MDAFRVVVLDVLAEQTSQVSLVQNHDMVEELAANGADEALCRTVLPGTLERRALGMETETLDHFGDLGAEDRIVVVDQESMGRSLAEGVAQLLAHPERGWTRGDVEGENASPPVIDREPEIEQPEAHGWHDEEIHRRDRVSVVAKEGGPALLRFGIGVDVRQVPRDRGEAHADSELRQLILDPPSAPPILDGHPHDQIPRFLRDPRSTGSRH